MNYKMRLKHLFKVLFRLYPYTNPEQSPGKYSRILLFTSFVCVFAQKVRLIWRHDFEVENWKHFESIWHSLAYLSIEQLFAQYQALFSFFVLFFSILTSTIILILVFSSRVIFQKSSNSFIKRAIELLLELQGSFLYIPFLITCTIFLKYSLVYSKNINECFGSLTSDTISLGIWGIFLALFGFVCLTCLVCFKEGFSYDIKHAHANQNIRTKAQPLTDIYNKMLTAIEILLYSFLSEGHYNFYLTIYIAIQAYIGFSYIYYLPYYSQTINWALASQELGACSIGIFFIISMLFNNGTIITLMSIFVLPTIIIILFTAVKWRQKKLVCNDEINCHLEYLELKCRKKLMKPKPSKKIATILDNYFEKRPSKLALVYLANHLNLKHGKYKNALLQISKIQFTGPGLFQNFQVYKCQKYLENINYKFSEGLQLKVVTKNLSKIKILELKLFDTIIFLIDSLQSKSISLSTAKSVLCDINSTINKLNQSYSKMQDKFPQSEILAEMYGSLLMMLGKSEHASKLLEKADFLHKENKKRNKLSSILSDKNAHVMIISGNSDNFGRVQYLSRSLCNFLSIIPTESATHHLLEFIPKVFHGTHYKKMMLQINYYNDDKIFRNLTLFLCDSGGFIVECCLNIDCVGYDASINFVVGISPFQNMGREVALITSLGEILNHSRKLPFIIGESKGNIEGSNVFDYFDEVSMQSFENDRPIFRSINKNGENCTRVALYLQKKSVGSQTIFLLYIIYDDFIISKLESESARNANLKRFSLILKLDSIEETQKIEEVNDNSPIRNNMALGIITSDFNVIGDFIRITTKLQVQKIVRLLTLTKLFIFLSVTSI